jgi:hypothetical protein
VRYGVRARRVGIEDRAGTGSLAVVAVPYSIFSQIKIKKVG